MPTAYRLRSPSDRQPLGRRGSGLAFAVAINLLILLALFGLGIERKQPRPAAGAIVVDLLPGKEQPAAQASPQQQAAAKPPPEPIPPDTPKPVEPVKPALVPPRKPLDLLVLSREEFAASDISKIPKAGRGSGSGSGAGDSQVVGRAPNGELLYRAEWARRPTRTELSAYLPRNMPDEGWGEIICRTAPGRRVEDCEEVDSFPRSSHLARAVLNAAWQFRVRPPRKNGRELVGEWVSIRINYSQEGGSGDAD